MKNNLLLTLGVLLGIGMISNTQQVSAHDLDTVNSDGSILPYETILKSIPTELEPFDGKKELLESFTSLPDNALEFEIDDQKNANPYLIHGPDNRTVVSDTTGNPYRRIALVLATFPNGLTYRGSGNLISQNVLLTAGHVIYSKNDGGWATKVSVFPGYDGINNRAPYGEISSVGLSTTSGWVNSRDADSDIGIIRLNKNIGLTTGWFGLTKSTMGSITLSGYHGDFNDYKMRTESGSIGNLSATRIYYTLDNTGGSSGSAIYNTNNRIVGVNAYSSSPMNYAVRINTEKYNLIQNWIGSNTKDPNDEIKFITNEPYMDQRHNHNPIETGKNLRKVTINDIPHEQMAKGMAEFTRQNTWDMLTNGNVFLIEYPDRLMMKVVGIKHEWTSYMMSESLRLTRGQVLNYQEFNVRKVTQADGKYDWIEIDNLPKDWQAISNRLRKNLREKYAQKFLSTRVSYGKQSNGKFYLDVINIESLDRANELSTRLNRWFPGATNEYTTPKITMQ
ncbi:trypsin-like serine peptidase [Enterococcus caccae]|uniref:Serine protease n=1 Tax=Enterococcus caccae ATCC BAA-1240 TaxID=1158612 RepID=R3WVL4_9ENTE|nr:trypsin-like peptidase domain-containing protein [Enterococcus caccae]EOL45840.1 hypothetical protein UC7_01637 [Enterococcus caccae ATCC BAA-1240]EOT61036.1 hypothetical protein I580_01938 [Enterococcus caccae ATCC BAA-1240]OJG27935.1 hypothetical protein RU98_GL002144 [Enterococcus caccae]